MLFVKIEVLVESFFFEWVVIFEVYLIDLLFDVELFEGEFLVDFLCCYKMCIVFENKVEFVFEDFEISDFVGYCLLNFYLIGEVFCDGKFFENF